MSFSGQVRFYDQHDDRDRTHGAPSSRGGNRGDRGGRGGPRGQNNRGGYRGGGRGRGNNRGAYRRDAQSAITSKFRGRGDWKSRQQQRRNDDNFRSKSALADDEDDVSMSGGTDNGSMSNRRGRYIPRGARGRSYGGGQSRNSWYRVNIPHGTKIDKKTLFDSLKDLMDMPFNPVNYHIQGENAVFFVQDQRVAESIRACSRRITNSNGYKVLFLTSSSNPPITTLDDEAKEKIKVAMSNRYTPELKALDLSDFHNDSDLNKEGIHPIMTRQMTLEAIAKIIEENIPEVECLLLSRNRLSDLRILTNIVTSAPNVIKLDLSENNIHNEAELDRIKDMKIVDMRLDKNPMSRKFRDETQYVAAVRKRFPKLIKLDGNELPAVISFAVEDTVELPPTQGSFFTSDTTKDLVVAFLEEYFRIFDSDDRQKLMDAYHENAYFSLSVFQYKSSSALKQPHLGDYQSDSRNLKILRDSVRQQKMLQHGKLSIVAQLSQLPKTQHDASTINVDVTLATPTMMSFTVTGVFKETSGKHRATRAFSRVFITVPRGVGIAILNEQLTITNPSPELSARSFKDPAPTPAPSPVMSSAVPATPAVQSPADIQQAMIRQFSAKSGMNSDWSTKCLAHNDWDFERSAKVFTEMMAKKQIPAEAFTNALSP